jgi:hypothetical protein
MFLCEQVPLNYQQVQKQDQEQNQTQDQEQNQPDMFDAVPDAANAGPVEPVEYMPLKKFYLIQKLNDLNIKIKQIGITNDSLETISQFADTLSYDTLLTLTNNIIQIINDEIRARAQNAKKVSTNSGTNVNSSK